MIRDQELKFLLNSTIEITNQTQLDIPCQLRNVKKQSLQNASQSEDLVMTGPVRCNKLHARRENPVWVGCSFCFSKDPCPACSNVSSTLCGSFIAHFTDDVSFEAIVFLTADQTTIVLEKQLLQLQEEMSRTETLARIGNEINSSSTFSLILHRRPKTSFPQVEMIIKS
jgi:hypothetical protein